MYKLVDQNDAEISVAYFNGYHTAGQFLEDCYFRISLNESKTEIIVEATDSTKKYLLGCKANVNEWEQDVKNYKFLDESLNSSPTSNSRQVFLEKV
jgi:hypothetical protein